MNRELTNRSDNQQAEILELKKRVKALQKDLAEVRSENKELTRYDPVRMKKNLAANKKTLAEKSKANELLQKSLNKARGENGELEGKVKELEAKGAQAQELAHLQLAGKAPLDNIMAHLEKGLPGVAKEAKVPVIVEKPLYQAEGTELVDVTALLTKLLPEKQE